MTYIRHERAHARDVTRMVYTSRKCLPPQIGTALYGVPFVSISHHHDMLARIYISPMAIYKSRDTYKSPPTLIYPSRYL